MFSYNKKIKTHIKIFLFLCGFIFSLDSVAFGQSVSQSYTKDNNQHKPILMTTEVGSNMHPVVPTYRGSDGMWHETTVISQICGTDAAGTPLPCPKIDSSTILQKSQLNMPSGVAALDVDGNLTAPLNTAGNLFATGNLQLGKTEEASVLPNDAGSSGKNALAVRPLITSGFRWNGDPWENAHTFMIGGKEAWQNGALAVYGAPYSYSNAGAVVDIEMGNGLWAGLRAGSGDFDAIAQFIQAGNTTPYYKIGADFTDDTGTTHSLSFDASGVTVTPALPESFARMWNKIGNNGPGVLVYTNLMADQPNKTATIPGFPAYNFPQLWSGYITGVTDGKGNTHLDMPGGWHSSSAWVGAQGPNNGAVPDTSIGLDQIFYNNYKNPLLVIGTYNQAFAQNIKCGLDYPSSSNYGTEILKNDAPVNSCQGNELDIYVPDTKPDGWMHAQGFTSVLENSTPLVSSDSSSFIAQGNWPTAYSTGLGLDGRDFFGGVLDVNSRRGPTSKIGSTTEILEAMQGGDAPTDARSNMVGIRLTQRTDTSASGGVEGIHYPTDNSLHWGEWVGGSQFGVNGDQFGQYGTYMGDLIFNPSWAKGGISLCGKNNNFTDNADACLSISENGTLFLGANKASFSLKEVNGKNGLSVDPGSFIMRGDNFHVEVQQGDIISVDGNGPNIDNNQANVHSWLTYGGGSAKYNFYSTVGANSDGTASAPSLLLSITDDEVITDKPLKAEKFIENLNTPSSSSASCTTGEFTDDTEYHYVCVSKNTWKRVALQSW